jgi:hypothetical protein
MRNRAGAVRSRAAPAKPRVAPSLAVHDGATAPVENAQQQTEVQTIAPIRCAEHQTSLMFPVAFEELFAVKKKIDHT